MDELDQRILAYIEGRGLQNSTALAHIFGVSERTIRRRLNSMVHNKLVKIIAVPNIVSLGFRAWARIGIKVSPGSLNRVAHVLVEHPSIYFVTFTLGRFDIIVSVYFDTIDKLTYFVNSELPKCKGILFVETMLLVSPRKYNQFSWPASVVRGKKDLLEVNHHDTTTLKHYEMDELDRRILGILMEDGLTRPKSLKSKLGIGESTIRKRLKDMLQNEVYKLDVIAMINMLEYETHATIGITINNEFPHQIIDSIIEHPAVYLASVSLGRFNLIIATRFRSSNMLNQFVTTFLPSIEGISSTETYLHVKRLKYYTLTWPILESPQY